MNNKPASLPSEHRPFLTQPTTCAAIRNPQSAIRNCKSTRAFSLIELLVVIAIIAIIAAILIPVGNIVEMKSRIQAAQSEEQALVTAIDNYHAKYGFYPPSNTNATFVAALTNQLYYELIGTIATNNLNPGKTNFMTLDGSSSILASTAQSTFGVPAFMNCTTGSGEDSRPAQTFLPGLKPGQIATNSNTGVYIITTASVSDAIYQPLRGSGFYSEAGRTPNPWRYLCPGINNPGSYDLWLQLYLGGKTYLICNWKTTPQINSPMP